MFAYCLFTAALQQEPFELQVHSAMHWGHTGGSLWLLFGVSASCYKGHIYKPWNFIAILLCSWLTCLLREDNVYLWQILRGQSVAAEALESCMVQIQFLLVNFIGRLIQIKIHSASLCKRQVCTVAAIIQNGSCWCFWSKNVYSELSASGAHLVIRRLREGGVPIATIVWTKFVL